MYTAHDWEKAVTSSKVLDLPSPPSKTPASQKGKLWKTDVDFAIKSSVKPVPPLFIETEPRKNPAKRALDIFLCLVSLPIFLPIMLLVAVAIRLESRGSVIFKQTRVGQFGQPFTCFKFRSMRSDAEEIKKALMAENEADGPLFKMKEDPRITKVGQFIRKASLDELPQLFNVLLGEMSLVGPRPALPSEVVQYNQQALGRLAAVPGLTGLQQVSGRSDLDFDEWIEYDLIYIQETGVLKDVEILVKTVPAVLTGKGAY